MQGGTVARGSRGTPSVGHWWSVADTVKGFAALGLRQTLDGTGCVLTRATDGDGQTSGKTRPTHIGRQSHPGRCPGPRGLPQDRGIFSVTGRGASLSLG